MKKYILLILMFMGCYLCYGQRYTLTSYMYTITKAPDYTIHNDVHQYSVIVLDLNKLEIEVHRKDKTYYLKILEMKNKANGGRNFKCADITGGRYLECWCNFDDMTDFLGSNTRILQMWFSYDNLNAYYFINGE